MYCIIFNLYYYDFELFHIPSSSECVAEDHVTKKPDFTLKLSSACWLGLLSEIHSVYSAIVLCNAMTYAKARQNYVLYIGLLCIYLHAVKKLVKKSSTCFEPS